MPSNKWTLVSGRNENRPRKYFPAMHWMVLAVLLIVSTTFADENANNKTRNIAEQIEDNIRRLRQAKEQVEREEREKNSLAALTDVIIKDSFDSQLMSKMDILYDNQTDLSKELKFEPQVFNCGKEFDIFKVLELAKAHRNITTEQPPCIMDVDDDMCSTKKNNAAPNNNKRMKTTSPQWKETQGVVRAFAIQNAMSTKQPSVPSHFGRRTEFPFIRQSSVNPLTKKAKLKTENKEKTPPLGKEAGHQADPIHSQKRLESKGSISNPPLSHRRLPSLGNVLMEENPPISEDQPESWHAPGFVQYEPQQYSSSIENQNKKDIPVKLQEAQESRHKASPESLQNQVKNSQIAQTISQQSQVVDQTPPPQVVKQLQVQNVITDEMAQQKQPGLEQTLNEVNEQGYQARQKAGMTANIVDEKKRTGVIKVQHQSHQAIKSNKQPPVQQIFTQSQFSEQQTSEKQMQQQPQLLDKQSQQQLQTIEQRNQQSFQTLEKKSQQQPQPLENQSHLQLLTDEQQKLLQSQIAEQQKQQQFQISEQQRQQQIQTTGQQQFQTMERHYTQLRTSEKHNQPQFQIIEKQSPVISAVTLSEYQSASGSEQQQLLQKTSQGLWGQQQTWFPQRIEQNQPAKPIANPITSAQQAVPQPVAKFPSLAPGKSLSESSSEKLLNSDFDKSMMAAPINVVMDPSLNFSQGTPTSKVNLITGNIPATAFWDYKMGHTAKIHNYDSLIKEKNKVASVANQLSSDIPESFQDHSKGDCLYYQDQD